MRPKKLNLRVQRAALIAAGALVLSLLAGFLLPSLVALIQDARDDVSVVTVETGSVSLSVTPSMTAAERLAAVEAYSSSVTIDQGRYLSDEGEAYETAVVELYGILQYGLFEFDLGNSYRDTYYIVLNVSQDDVTQSLIIWYLRLYDDYGRVMTVGLDDETGMILYLDYESESAGDVLYDGYAAESYCGMLSDYYGLSFAPDETAYTEKNLYDDFEGTYRLYFGDANTGETLGEATLRLGAYTVAFN